MTPLNLTRPKALICAAALLLMPSAWSAPDRNDLTAAMVYRMTKFTDWPAVAFEAPESNFVICFDQPNEVFERLQEVELKPWRGRAVRVQPSVSASCHVAVVGEVAGSPRLQASTGAMLTVSLNPALYDSGAHVLLEFKRGRLMFSVNRSLAEQQGLSFSSEFLSLAKEVR